MRKLFAGLFLLFVSTPAFAVKLSSMAWLEGNWKSQNGIEASFTSTSGGKILGVSKFLTGQHLDFFEFLQIEESGDNLVLKPSPFGQPGVNFVATEFNNGIAKGVEFKNDTNEFPKEIAYLSLPDGSLWLRVKGVQNGNPVTLSYTLVKSN